MTKPKTNPEIVAAYQRAITTLASPNMSLYDFIREVAVKLAQQDPVMFNKLVQEVTSPMGLLATAPPGVYAAASVDLSKFARAFTSQNRVESIKAVREAYSLSLTEAKRIVDAIWGMTYTICNGDYSCISDLPAEHQSFAIALASMFR